MCQPGSASRWNSIILTINVCKCNVVLCPTDLWICRRREEADDVRGLKVYFAFTSGHCCLSFSLVSSPAEKGYMACLLGKLTHIVRQPLQSSLDTGRKVATSSRKKVTLRLGITWDGAHLLAHGKQLLWTSHLASSNSSSLPTVFGTRMPWPWRLSVSSKTLRRVSKRVSWMDIF